MSNRALPLSRRLDLTRLKADLLLVMVALIWGSGFVAQQAAIPYLGVFVFNGVRFLIASLLLLPLVRWQWKIERASVPWVAAGGVLLAVASGLQQAGLGSTTVANAGFITGLYVIIIPVILWVVWRQHLTWVSWVAAGVAVLGTGLLSGGASFLDGAPGGLTALRFSAGDGLELLGAFFWALHVVVVGRAARTMDPLQFAMGQFFISGAINLGLGLILQADTLPGLLVAWPTVLFSAVFPIAAGFTLQVVGQKRAPTMDAALILSLETVFAAMFGFLLLKEYLNGFQLLGAVLILAAIFLSQIFQSPPSHPTGSNQPE